MKLLYKIFIIQFAFLILSCEEEPINNSSTTPGLESTLSDSELSLGITGQIDEYFYDLDEGVTPSVNTQFHKYSE